MEIVSSGQFDAKIISFAEPEFMALHDCFDPTDTFPVSGADYMWVLLR